MDFGILLLRLLLAGCWSGTARRNCSAGSVSPGPAGTATVFEEWGFVPVKPKVLFAGVLELVGAISPAAGLLTRAVPRSWWHHDRRGRRHRGERLLGAAGGCEVPFCYGALATIVVFAGLGRWSLDIAPGLSSLSGYAGLRRPRARLAGRERAAAAGDPKPGAAIPSRAIRNRTAV